LPFIYSSPSPSTREQQIKRTQWIRGKTDELPFIFSSPSTRGQQINRTQRIRGKTDSTIRRTRRGMESLPDIGEVIFPEWAFVYEHKNENKNENMNKNSKYKNNQQQSKTSPKVDKKSSSFGKQKKGITATEIEDDSVNSDGNGDDVGLSLIKNNEPDNTMSDSNEIYSSTEDDNKTQTEETLSPPNHNNDNNTAEVDHPNRLPSITTTTTTTSIPGPVTVPTPSSTSTTNTDTDIETITSPEQSQLQPQLSPTPLPIVSDININSYSPDRLDVITVELLDDEIRVINNEEKTAAAEEEIVQLEIGESNSNTNDTEKYWAEQRRVTIISCSVAVAGFVIGILFVVLNFIYQLRQKRRPISYSSYLLTRQVGSRHVPLEDESCINNMLQDDNNNNNSNNNYNSNMKSRYTANIESGKYTHENEKELTMSMVYPHLIHKGDSDTSSDDGDDDDEVDNCFNDPDFNIVTFEGGRPSEETVFLANDTELFRLNHSVHDAYKDVAGFHICSAATCVACEQRRRLGIVNPFKQPVFKSVKGSSARTPTLTIATNPRTTTRTTTTIIRSPSSVIGPRIERTPWTAEAYTRSEAYTRQYALDDVVEL